MWSPDGTRIAFDGLVAHEQGIHVVDVDSGRVSRLTAGYDTDPRWSPDGSSLAFVRMTPLPHRDARLDVYVIRARGSGLIRLTPPRLKKAFDPAWSPDGSRLVFVGQRELIDVCAPADAIYAMAADGTRRTRLTPPRPLYGIPTWSPDGEWIALESLSRRDCLTGLGDADDPIYVMRPDGSGLHRLPSGASTELGLAWRP
jgi:Tol biopolymer transport system component